MLIKAGNTFIVHIVPKDIFGNVAKIDGSPIWVVSNPDVSVLETLDIDGLKVKFTSTGLVGSTVIGVSVDADLSEGIVTLTGELAVDIEAGQASDLGLHVEPPVEIIVTPPEPEPVPEPEPEPEPVPEPPVVE